MEIDDGVSVPNPASEDQTERNQGWKNQRNGLTKLLLRPEFVIEVVYQSPSRLQPDCQSLRCESTLIRSGYRAEIARTSYKNSAGDTTLIRGPDGLFHVRCLEDLLELSSPDVLPHIVFGNAPDLVNQLDRGAIEIMKAWYGQCAMDNKISVAIKAEPADEDTSDSESSTLDPPDPLSSSQTLTAPSRTALQWEGKPLIPLSTLRRKRDKGNDDKSWYKESDELFVPWAEQIVTGELPRLPKNGGLILHEDVELHSNRSPILDKEGRAWHILAYLPEPSLWRGKHTLSESLDRWNADRVTEKGVDNEIKQDEIDERKDRLGFKVTRKIRELSQRAPSFPRTELMTSQ